MRTLVALAVSIGAFWVVGAAGWVDLVAGKLLDFLAGLVIAAVLAPFAWAWFRIFRVGHEAVVGLSRGRP